MDAADVPLLGSTKAPAHGEPSPSSPPSASAGAAPTPLGYRTDTWKASLYLVACVLTLGIFFLLSRWLLALRVWALHTACSLREAEFVLIEETNPRVGEAGASLEPVFVGAHERFFVHKGLRYVLADEELEFVCHEYPVVGARFERIHTMGAEEQRRQSQDERRARFGPNEMSVPVPSVLELVVDELLHPFYVFQVFSVAIWILQVYWIYATAIFVLATAGLVFSVVQTRRNNANLQRMARHHAQVSVMRGDRRVVVESTALLPGDLVALDDQINRTLVCDMVLLGGECVVNESSLTGESVPVIKSALPAHTPEHQPPFDYALHARHVLFCGTDLRRVRGSPVALVTRTAYLTAKGEMIRQILYPKTQVFRFYRDALIFLAVLFAVTVAGFGWSMWKFITGGATSLLVALRVLDLFTIVIPPALPIAMTAGTSFAVARLRQNGIFCVVPKAVNIAGRVNVMCFDKTGTLTADHMDVHCVRAVGVTGARFDAAELKAAGDVKSAPLLWTLAACHSVVKLSQAETVGDPLDVKMMQWTRWSPSSFDDMAAGGGGIGDTVRSTMTSPDGASQLSTLVRHEFSSSLARMSCIVRAPDGATWALVKGAPEQIKARCDARSVPADFDAVLGAYTAQGMRTIALAAKQLRDTSVAAMQQREHVETELTLLGLLVLVNPLKEESRPLVLELQRAQVRVLMVTGDNPLTAINVARKCEIARVGHTACLVDVDAHGVLSATLVRTDSVEPARFSNWEDVLGPAFEWDVCMTGAAFDHLIMTASPLVQEVVLRHTSVFARTSPLQKTHIVAALKFGGDNTVGMCGDGSNDCGALKTADAGISISDGEAAIAAPFTAASVTAVTQLLLEGRCALATSFTLFKFMIMYSVIQFVGVIICYVFLNLFADLQFLWVDLFLILPLSFTMGLTGPVDRLSPSRPPQTLFRASVIMSLVGHIVLMTACYAASVAWAQAQPWYNSPTTLLNGGSVTPSVTQLVTIVFLFGNFIYVDVAFAYSIGHPFRRPFWFNPALSLALAAAVACNIAWYWTRNARVQSFWSIVQLPGSFLAPLFGLVCGLFAAIYLWEIIIVRVLQPRDILMHERPR